MKPSELLDALRPLVGRHISTGVAAGHVHFVVCSVQYLAPKERAFPRYDIILERADRPGCGIVIPAARVKGVRFEGSNTCVLELAHGKEKRIFDTSALDAHARKEA